MTAMILAVNSLVTCSGGEPPTLREKPDRPTTPLTSSPRRLLPPAPLKPRDIKDPAVKRGNGVVHWKSWNAETLADAKKSNKLILLFISPEWNHFGKLMERTTFTDLEIAVRLNEEFIPIRVNRDEFPDLDIRMQMATHLLFEVRGWPLTVFLTPEGNPFYGGTYFPAEDDLALEKTGLQTVIHHIFDTWLNDKETILKQAATVAEALQSQPKDNDSRGIPDADVMTQVIAKLYAQLDKKAGGFLTHGAHEGAKFPAGPALELASLCHTNNSSFSNSNAANELIETQSKEIVIKTLDAIIQGAVYDQLGGGFHRATLDRWWRQPRFEKLLSLNAEMLSALASAHKLGLTSYETETNQTAKFWCTELSTPDELYFYGSQASGRNGLEEGDYYTWTLKEIESIFTNDASLEKVVALFGIKELGSLTLTSPERNVLIRTKQWTTIDAHERENILTQLRQIRAQRPAPPIDKNIYVDSNALMVNALLQLSMTFKNDAFRLRGLRTLDALLKNAIPLEHADAHPRVAHVLSADGKIKIPSAYSQDMCALAAACVTAYEVTRHEKYLTQAVLLLNELDRRFWDNTRGGYFDRVPTEAHEAACMKWPVKLYQDTTEINANGLGAIALMRLSILTGKREYENRAIAILAAFGAALQDLGPYGARLCIAAELLREKTVNDQLKKAPK
jgi:uncharacterized protein YyaL (SSP411 family)